MTRTSTLRRAAALVAIPATIAAFAAPAAWAQDEADPLAVAAAQACGRVTLTATVGQNFGTNDTYEIGVFSGPNAGDADAKMEGQFRVSADPGTATQTFTLDEDAYDGSGFVRWVTLSGPESQFFVSGVVGVETDCAPPVEEEPEPTPDPDPVDPDPVDPDPTEPGDQDGRTDDLDCSDFPLADGRTAQNVLDADPSDPHRLDAEGDGLACEIDEDEDTTDPAAPAGDGTGDDTTGDTNTGSDEATGIHYENCAAVRDAGAAPLYATDPGFRAELDRNNNGIGCEDPTDGGTLYDPVIVGEDPADYSQTGEVPRGSAETGAA